MTTPSHIRDTVRRFAVEHDLLPPGGVVVAVSGGTDSTALLLLLSDLSAELALVLHVAHFDHRIRRSGAAEAQRVSELAARAGATFRAGRAEVAPKSEDEARRLRYEFLRRVASERGAARIATGHTRDDQAETVLLHIARGSGIAGLAGMRPLRDGVARPLLAIGRAETSAVCSAAGLTPIEDPTNRSLRLARNRIRRKVMPELATVNPQVATALARLADVAAEVAMSQRSRADALLAGAQGDGAIDLRALGTDEALREEALALAWERATGHILTARHRAAIASQLSSEAGRAALDLPGGRLVRDRAEVRIEPRGRDESPAT